MANLTKISLGTPPLGVDGDDNRSASVKHNSNIDVLATQAALTSATPITAAQTLTAAHVGKRVSIKLTSAGTMGVPKAADAGADGVVHLVNAGTTVVTLAITSGSGDTIGLTKLNPGEAVLFQSDGVHAWTVLLRGRTNSDNEVVNGDLSVGDDATIGGDLLVSGTATFTNPAVLTGGVAGDLSIDGNVFASNPANIFPNGTGELGNSTWLSHNFGVRQDSGNRGMKYGNTLPIPGGGTVQDTSLPFPLFPSVVCLQAEAYNSSSGPVGIILDTLDSAGNVVTSIALELLIPGGSGTFNFYSKSAALTGTFTQGQIRFLAGQSVAAPAAAGIQFRNIKLSMGSTPSLYSQEASVAYLNTLTTGRLLNVVRLTGSGNYTPSSSTVTSIIVELQGGGCGSAGLVANNSAQAGISGSGSTGGYVKHRYTSGFSNLAYSVGAAGAAGPVGNGTGGNGGNTTFGSLVAGGGTGSATQQTTGSTAAGSGVPGTATGGNLINAPGVSNVPAWIIISAGMIVPTPATPSTYFGLAYGWGAPGRGTGGNAAAIAGLPGGVGTIIVYEYA